MSGYLSNLLTNTTSKYNTLRRNLLSDEADGDTEDDSHISRVLRAYYTEKGQTFPEWLPPDPKRGAPGTSSAHAHFANFRQPSHIGQTQVQSAAPSGQRGSLSDLWDSPSQQAGGPSQQPVSLRRQTQERRDTTQPSAQARPLPSQRAGTYQTQPQAPQRQYSELGLPGGNMSGAGGAGGGGGTAQERLKARLWGAARAASPTLGGAPSSTSIPTLSSQSGGVNSYANQGASQGGNPYANQQPGDPYASGGGRGYDGGGDAHGGRYGRERGGAPNGPRPTR